MRPRRCSDADPILREGIAAVIESQPADMQIVGEASNGADAIKSLWR